MNNAMTTGGTLRSKQQRIDSRRHLPIMLFPGTPLPMFIVDDAKTYACAFASGDVENLNGDFIAVLNDLGKDVQHYGVDLRDYKHNYLSHLRNIGGAAYNHFLPDTMRKYIQLLHRQEAQRGLNLTFTASPTLSPFWEMLYEGKPFGQPDPEQFWGFCYPIGRIYWEMKPLERISIQTGVFSSVHQQLVCSLQEVEQLATWVKEVCQRFKPDVTMRLLNELIPINALSTETIIELFNSEGFSYGVVHFACHYWNPPDEGATQTYLSLTAHEKEVEIPLEKLIAWQDYGFRKSPFVFLNACASATPNHLLQTITLPNTLLKFGAGGVLATACTIPDNFASAFATEFYQCLLSKTSVDARVNISEALMETRLYFQQKYNNPLGLAYGLYAGSKQELCLAH